MSDTASPIEIGVEDVKALCAIYMSIPSEHPEKAQLESLLMRFGALARKAQPTVSDLIETADSSFSPEGAVLFRDLLEALFHLWLFGSVLKENTSDPNVGRVVRWAQEAHHLLGDTSFFPHNAPRSKAEKTGGWPPGNLSEVISEEEPLADASAQNLPLSPTPFSLGAVAGMLTEEEETLVRSITQLTGYVPVLSTKLVGGKPEEASVTYRYLHQRTGEWTDRTEVNDHGQPRELMLLALRKALRSANLDHRRT